MKSNYVIWKYASYPAGCVLQDLTGLDQSYRMKDGTAFGGAFPQGVSFHMNPDFPNDLALGDSLLNSDMVIVGSARLKDFLAARNESKVEYLPVNIIDHRGRVASSDYFVIHPVEPVDCLDRGASDYEEDILDPDSIGFISKLVLDETCIPADRGIFCLAGYWDLTFVRRDLADAISAEGFSGIRWLELSGHPES